MESIQDPLDTLMPELLELYQDLHAHPELSLQEERTAGTLVRFLTEHGVSCTSGIGGHGVVSVIGDGSHPVIMLRADMDALPLTEKTGLPYASQTVARGPSGHETGVMHACGHDIHSTVLAGTAILAHHGLMDRKGTVMCVFQPSEEMVSGALRMIEHGLFTRFYHPDCAIALHVDPFLPAGQIGIREGPFSSGADSINVTIHGRAGHAAYPEKTRDPVVTAASIILALQTIVSREISPHDFCVITVGSIHSGFKHNLIPDTASLQINLRYYREEVREKALGAIERIIHNTAIASGMPEDLIPEITVIDESVPPLMNDITLTRKVKEILEEGLGPLNVHEIPPLSGSEDFSYYGKVSPKISLCYFRLGSYGPSHAHCVPAEERPPLHNPRYAPDPSPTIRTGVQAFLQVIQGLTR